MYIMGVKVKVYADDGRSLKIYSDLLKQDLFIGCSPCLIYLKIYSHRFVHLCILCSLVGPLTIKGTTFMLPALHDLALSAQATCKRLEGSSFLSKENSIE